MKELVEKFESDQIRKIRDWYGDNIKDDKSCAQVVKDSLIDENGGILDDRGRKRLLLGIFALCTLVDTAGLTIVGLRNNRILSGISVFKMDSDEENYYIEFNFKEC